MHQTAHDTGDNGATRSAQDDHLVVCPQCHRANRVRADRPAHSARCGHCRSALFTGHPAPVGGVELERHIVRSEIPIVVDFWAPWCGPCRAMTPAFTRAAERLEPRARFLKVDTEAHPELAARHGIRSIPTTVVFRGGREVGRLSGAMDAQNLMRWVEQYL